MDIDVILDQFYALPLVSKNALKEHIEEVEHPKGHILMRENKAERDIYLLKKGIVRAYANYNGHEVTFWFGKEGQLVASMNNYVRNENSYEDIELLEDCVFYKLKNITLQSLYETDIHIANWGRKLAEYNLIEAEQRLISRLIKTASERYRDLLNEESDLLARVKLSHIASYLGITQVSLSRIRAELR